MVNGATPNASVYPFFSSIHSWFDWSASRPATCTTWRSIRWVTLGNFTMCFFVPCRPRKLGCCYKIAGRTNLFSSYFWILWILQWFMLIVWCLVAKGVFLLTLLEDHFLHNGKDQSFNSRSLANQALHKERAQADHFLVGVTRLH